LICRNRLGAPGGNIPAVQGELQVSSAPEDQVRLRDPVVSARANDDNVLMRTRRLSRAVTEVYDDKLQPFGISAIQFSLLEVIDRLAPATRAAIARNQSLDKSTLTRDLRSILSEGWVEEVREQADGRSRPIAPTQAGKQLLLDAGSAWRAAHNEVKALLRQHGFIASSVDR
jgi:DNA-binding MarR family transcriptional regulator